LLRRSGWSLEAWALASLVLLVAFFPLVQLAWSAVSDPSDAIGWIPIWINGTLGAELRQTAGVCGVAAAVAIAASAPQAVAVAMFRFRGAIGVELAALAPMLLAPYAAAGSWAGLDLGAWSHGALPMAVQIGFSCAPWSYVALRVAMSRLPPSLGEAAAAAGMRQPQRIVKVWAPLLLAPTLAAAMFAAAKAFGDYGTAERNGTHTFGVAFHDMWNGAQSQSVAASLALVALLPAIAAAWVVATRVGRSPPRQFAGVAGAAQFRKMRPSKAALAGIATWSLLCVGLSVLAPEWQYIDWAIDGRWMGWAKTLRVVRDAMVTSGAVAAVLAVVGGVCAILLRPGARGGMPERLIWLVSINLFIPPMALALAWLMATADGTWLAGALGAARDGKVPILLAQSAKLAPFALLPVIDRISRENESLRDALRTIGMGRFKIWSHMLRMAAPAIALGAAMAFMEAVKELEIALTLQHFGYQSPAIKIHSLARFHSEYAIANWVLISQALMLPALAVVAVWLSKLNQSGRLR
jgi:iron(III) transport system permease protein